MMLARTLVILGIVLIILGGLVHLAARIRLPVGHLPGDIVLERGGVRIYLPLATSILASLVLTAILNLALRLWRR